MANETPKEIGVFWLGGKPGTAKDANAPAEGQQFEQPVRAACGHCGVTVDNFVAALGGYGSWLAEYVHGGHRHRLIWNGRDKRLSVDRALPQGGWEELVHQPIDRAGTDSFVAATRQLLATLAPGESPDART